MTTTAIRARMHRRTVPPANSNTLREVKPTTRRWTSDKTFKEGDIVRLKHALLELIPSDRKGRERQIELLEQRFEGRERLTKTIVDVCFPSLSKTMGQRITAYNEFVGAE